MAKVTEVIAAQQPVKKSYHEPLLIRHEPLRDVTGQKYVEKSLGDKITPDKSADDVFD